MSSGGAVSHKRRAGAPRIATTCATTEESGKQTRTASGWAGGRPTPGRCVPSMSMCRALGTNPRSCRSHIDVPVAQDSLTPEQSGKPVSRMPRVGVAFCAWRAAKCHSQEHSSGCGPRRTSAARESRRAGRLCSLATRFGPDSGRSAPCVRPETPRGNRRENVRSVRDVLPQNVQLSVAIDIQPTARPTPNSLRSRPVSRRSAPPPLRASSAPRLLRFAPALRVTRAYRCDSKRLYGRQGNPAGPSTRDRRAAHTWPTTEPPASAARLVRSE